MKEKSEQFASWPNLKDFNLKERGLTNTDPLVYICIKIHDNPQHECFPSFNTIMKMTNYSRSTVIASIKRLESAGFLKVERKDKKNYYSFPKIGEHFEEFSRKFIESKLNPKHKEYLILLQHNMLRDKDSATGKILMSDREIAKELQIDRRTLKNIEEGLQNTDPPILTVTPSNYKDKETGFLLSTREYNFKAYFNAIASEFIKVYDELDKKVDYKDIDLIKEELKEELKKELKEEMAKKLKEDNQIKQQIIL